MNDTLTQYKPSVEDEEEFESALNAVKGKPSDLWNRAKRTQAKNPGDIWNGSKSGWEKLIGGKHGLPPSINSQMTVADAVKSDIEQPNLAIGWYDAKNRMDDGVPVNTNFSYMSAIKGSDKKPKGFDSAEEIVAEGMDAAGKVKDTWDTGKKWYDKFKKGDIGLKNIGDALGDIRKTIKTGKDLWKKGKKALNTDYEKVGKDVIKKASDLVMGDDEDEDEDDDEDEEMPPPPPPPPRRKRVRQPQRAPIRPNRSRTLPPPVYDDDEDEPRSRPKRKKDLKSRVYNR